MGYRRDGKTELATKRSWDRWLASHGQVLREVGLPDVVLQDEEHWRDFLMHGHLDHHPDPSGFSTRDFTPENAKRAAAAIQELLPEDERDSAVALLQLQGIANEEPA